MQRSTLIVRPTALALALLNASAKAMSGVDHPTTNPAVPWPARRLALSQGNIGMVSEPSIKVPRRAPPAAV